jgi:hypothetical protein
LQQKSAEYDVACWRPFISDEEKQILFLIWKIYFGYKAVSCKNLASRTTGGIPTSKDKYLLRNSRDFIEP